MLDTNELQLIDNNDSVAMQTLFESINRIDSVLHKDYLEKIEQFYLEKIPKKLQFDNMRKSTKLIKIDQTSQGSIAGLDGNLRKIYASLYEVGNQTKSSIVVCTYLVSDGSTTDVYIGIKTETKLEMAYNILYRGLKGAFGNIQIHEKPAEIVSNELNMFENDESSEISVLTCVPSKYQDSGTNRHISDIDSFIRQMNGCPYAAVIISESIHKDRIMQMKEQCENILSQLSPFRKMGFSFGKSNSISLTNSEAKSITNSISDSISKLEGKSFGNTVTNGTSTSTSFNIGVSGLGLRSTEGEHYSKGKIESKNSSVTMQESVTDSQSCQLSRGTAQSSGQSQAIGLEYENRTIKSLIDTLEQQYMRFQIGAEVGMWKSAAYFISNRTDVSQQAAIMFKNSIKGRSIGRGESYINTFNLNTDHELKRNLMDRRDKLLNQAKTASERDKIEESYRTTINNEMKHVKRLLKYIHHLKHPRFIDRKGAYGYAGFDACAVLNTDEMSVLQALPTIKNDV